MPHRLNVGLLYGAMAVAAIVATVVSKLWLPAGWLPAVIAYAAIYLMITVFSILAWRSMDEAARDAHKSAWFWGGGAGAALAAFVVTVLTGPGADLFALIPAQDGPSGYLGFGVLMTLILQLIGFVIVWAGWWLSKR